MTNILSAAAQAAPVAEIRSHFPALARLQAGLPVAYFDGPGGTQVPRAVVEAMNEYLYHHNANTHWAYPTSVETDVAVLSARQALADFLNAAPDEITFGANMTTLAFHLSRALGRQLAPGDEIVVTELDHHANVDPWRVLAEERGLTLRVARMIAETGQLDWEDYERQLTKHTRLVAIGAASNALGTVTDVCRAADLAHACGALCFVDAVHYAPHALTDVRALNCDFLACSAYKFNGPHLGMLYGRRELLETINFPKLRPASDRAPEKAETGTLNHEGIVGAAAAIDFFATLSAHEGARREKLQATFDELHTRGMNLFKRMWEGLSSIKGVRLYGPAPGACARTPTVSFTVRGLESEAVALALANHGVFVSHGDFYATTLVERLGLTHEGLVRAGCAVYTTDEEIDRLIEGVQQLRKDEGGRRRDES
ncbi:MAG: cysteine desulfurase-like protein [Pyrinomonadaceae bacterium]